MTEKRNSRIELLRIFAIIGITCYHNKLHGGYLWDTVNYNKIIVDVISMFGKVGVNLFALISGYYFAGRKFKSKKVIKIAINILIVAISLSLVTLLYLVFSQNVRFTISMIKEFVFAFFPEVLSDYYWYGSFYLILLFFAPFIYRMTSQLSKDEFSGMIIILMIVYCIIPTLTLSASYKYGWTNYLQGFIVYVLGIYLRKYPRNSSNRKKTICILATSISIQLLSPIIINIAFLVTGFNSILSWTTYLSRGNTITSMVISVLLFEITISNSWNNDFINRIADCTFTMYLIQEHVLFRDNIWNRLFGFNKYQNSFKLIPVIVLSIIVLFIFAMAMQSFINIYITKFNIRHENLFSKIDDATSKYFPN